MGKGDLGKSHSSRDGRDKKKPIKKNISKKDEDRQKRMKRHQKLEKIKERKA